MGATFSNLGRSLTYNPNKATRLDMGSTKLPRVALLSIFDMFIFWRSQAVVRPVNLA